MQITYNKCKGGVRYIEAEIDGVEVPHFDATKSTDGTWTVFSPEAETHKNIEEENPKGILLSEAIHHGGDCHVDLCVPVETHTIVGPWSNGYVSHITCKVIKPEIQIPAVEETTDTWA